MRTPLLILPKHAIVKGETDWRKPKKVRQHNRILTLLHHRKDIAYRCAFQKGRMEADTARQGGCDKRKGERGQKASGGGEGAVR